MATTTNAGEASTTQGSVRREGTLHIVENMRDTEVEVVCANWKQRVRVSHCYNTSLRVTGKCNGIQMDSCGNCTLLLDNSALLELQRVQATEVQAANLLGRAELHHCSDVVLFLPESNTSAEVDFSLRSSACTDIKITVVEQGGGSRRSLVPCTVETVFNQEGEPVHKSVQ